MNRCCPLFVQPLCNVIYTRILWHFQGSALPHCNTNVLLHFPLLRSLPMTPLGEGPSAALDSTFGAMLIGGESNELKLDGFYWRLCHHASVLCHLLSRNSVLSSVELLWKLSWWSFEIQATGTYWVTVHVWVLLSDNGIQLRFRQPGNLAASFSVQMSSCNSLTQSPGAWIQYIPWSYASLCIITWSQTGVFSLPSSMLLRNLSYTFCWSDCHALFANCTLCTGERHIYLADNISHLRRLR